MSMAKVNHECPEPLKATEEGQKTSDDRRMRHGFSSAICGILEWTFANAPFFTLSSPGERWQKSVDAVSDRGGQPYILPGKKWE